MLEPVLTLFATTIFSEYNIVATLFNYCDAVLLNSVVSNRLV